VKRILLFVLLVSPSIYSQEKDLYTNESPNGRFWRALDERNKVALVIGYEQAVVFVHAFNATSPKDDTLTVARRFYPIGVTPQETIIFLNQIFAAPENARLPLSYGIFAFAMKVQGKPETEIANFLRSMRASLP
jgi:hypothetical protein